MKLLSKSALFITLIFALIGGSDGHLRFSPTRKRKLTGPRPFRQKLAQIVIIKWERSFPISSVLIPYLIEGGLRILES